MVEESSPIAVSIPVISIRARYWGNGSQSRTENSAAAASKKRASRSKVWRAMPTSCAARAVRRSAPTNLGAIGATDLFISCPMRGMTARCWFSHG